MNSIDPQSTASKVVDFIAGLFAMDSLSVPVGNAAIDLRAGLIIRPHEDFPDGEMLLVEYAPGQNPDLASISTHKLVESLLVRHAEAMAITNPEGGKARAHYEHISDHFSRKTGIGVE